MSAGVAPVGPVGPVAPVGPVGPVGPVEPVGPVGPVGPVEPVGPVGPVAPRSPVLVKLTVNKSEVENGFADEDARIEIGTTKYDVLFVIVPVILATMYADKLETFVILICPFIELVLSSMDNTAAVVSTPVLSTFEILMSVARFSVALFSNTAPEPGSPDVKGLNVKYNDRPPPTDPVGPVGPVGPVAPVGPVGPVEPVGPTPFPNT